MPIPPVVNHAEFQALKLEVAKSLVDGNGILCELYSPVRGSAVFPLPFVSTRFREFSDRISTYLGRNLPGVESFDKKSRVGAFLTECGDGYARLHVRCEYEFTYVIKSDGIPVLIKKKRRTAKSPVRSIRKES